jgi:LPXTG-motif cell wall-anchored protein
MKKSIRSITVTVVAAMAMLAMVSTAAFAQYPPAAAFGVACTSAGQAGASVTCTVVGAAAGEQLTATAAYGSTQFFSEVLSANADGEARFRFTAPREARGQQIIVTVSGEISGTVSTELTLAAPGRTGEAVGEGRLARTGQDAILLGAGGLVLLAGGALALRRRRADERIDA